MALKTRYLASCLALVLAVLAAFAASGWGINAKQAQPQQPTTSAMEYGVEVEDVALHSRSYPPVPPALRLEFAGRWSKPC